MGKKSKKKSTHKEKHSHQSGPIIHAKGNVYISGKRALATNYNHDKDSSDSTDSSSEEAVVDQRLKIFDEYLKKEPKKGTLNTFFADRAIPEDRHVDRKTKRGIETVKANCSGLDLSDKNLKKADLTKANLEQTNLSGCTWSGTTLFRTKIDDAEITRAVEGSLKLSQLVEAKYESLKAEDDATKELIGEAEVLKPYFELNYLLVKKYPQGFADAKSVMTEKDKAKIREILTPEMVREIQSVK